jgi:ABC-type multidrug transport system ATPase subunit
MTPMLIATGISKSFGRRAALKGVDLEVASGEAVAVVGANGSGKTTLLRICAGLLDPGGGEVRISGRVGYCPQDPGLVDLLNADEHLILFGRGLGLSRRASLEQGRAALASVGFPVADRAVVRDLSGGTRQKLNLALALLASPEVLMLDEPYQGFDLGSYLDFWKHVDGWREEGRAVVIVTHLLAESERVDRTVELTIIDKVAA